MRVYLPDTCFLDPPPGKTKFRSFLLLRCKEEERANPTGVAQLLDFFFSKILVQRYDKNDETLGFSFFFSNQRYLSTSIPPRFSISSHFFPTPFFLSFSLSLSLSLLVLPRCDGLDQRKQCSFVLSLGLDYNQLSLLECNVE